MTIKAITQDGTVHTFDKTWHPPIKVPAEVHERTLRNINQTREEAKK